MYAGNGIVFKQLRLKQNKHDLKNMIFLIMVKDIISYLMGTFTRYRLEFCSQFQLQNAGNPFNGVQLSEVRPSSSSVAYRWGSEWHSVCRRLLPNAMNMPKPCDVWQCQISSYTVYTTLSASTVGGRSDNVLKDLPHAGLEWWTSFRAVTWFFVISLWYRGVFFHVFHIFGAKILSFFMSFLMISWCRWTFLLISSVLKEQFY